MIEEETVKKPNIVLINCDDLGYGDLGCYGSELNSTPHLDRLAEEGTRFTDFYMASPVCSPSRGAMMTGCYPPRIGFGKFHGGSAVLFPGHPSGLNPSEITLPQLLKEQGYATKIVGKWHCGDQPEFMPTRHGFDSYYGVPFSNDMGRQRGREDAPPLPLLRDGDVIQQQPDQTSLTERYVEESVRFLRDNQAKPFFLYLAHMHVHLPHYPPEHFLKQSRNGRYGGAVECIDWSVGAIRHELRELGLADDTLIIFTSDNGSRARDEGGSNAPLHGRKATTWEGGIRVPCIMNWPGTLPAGRTCSEMATAMDFLPTLAALAGAGTPEDRIIDGKDIRPLMFDEPGASSPHEAFFYYRKNNLEAIRAGKWKLFVSRDGEPVKELYDLENDIGETKNAAAEHPDTLRQLEAHAGKCREDIGDEVTGVTGANCRPAGHVDNAKALTEYDPNHPYIIAMYDLPGEPMAG